MSGLGYDLERGWSSRWNQPCGPVDLRILHRNRAKVGSSKVGGPGQGPGLPGSESIRTSKWLIKDMIPDTLAFNQSQLLTRLVDTEGTGD